MFHHCVPLLVGIFRPGVAERRIVLEKKSPSTARRAFALRNRAA
jgi:hypothetical protein